MRDKKIQSESQKLEALVAKIQKNLAPQASVLHNIKIKGRRSGVDRQIDVLMEQNVGQLKMIIALECKDLSSPADVNVIGEFQTVLDDIAAHKGVLVCPSGFTKAAKEMARSYQIELYSPFDTDSHKWQVQAKAPAICDFRSAAISFGFSHSQPGPLMLPRNFLELEVFNKEKEKIGVIYDSAFRKWNEGKFPTEPGVHKDLPIFDETHTLIDNGYGSLIKIRLYVGLWVTQKLYFAELPIPEISGFRDEQTGKVIANAFTTNLISPEEIENDWRLIDTEQDTPVEPLIRINGLVGFAV